MEQETQTVKETKKTNIMAGAVVVAGALIALAIYMPKAPSMTDQTALADKSQENKSSLLFTPVNESDHARGAENPKITLVEFSDFGCHFCGVLHPTLIAITEKYPDEVQWVYRQLPFRNMPAALAAECVDILQGEEAFWSFTDTLFANRSSISDEYMRSVAMSLGIQDDDFQVCIESEEASERVKEDQLEATLLNITATPYTVLITDTGRELPLRGALPQDRFEQIIDSLLNS